MQLAQLRLVTFQFLQQGLPVGQADIPPHFRMAGGEVRIGDVGMQYWHKAGAHRLDGDEAEALIFGG